MNNTTWHDYAEWSLKIALAFFASFVGVSLIARYNLGEVGQSMFWPTYAALFYWVVISEIKLRRPKPEPKSLARVVLTFSLESGEFGTDAERKRIHRFTDKLDLALNSAQVCEYDGDEFGGGQCTLFTYGLDAEAMYQVIRPLLLKASFLQGAKVELFAPGASIATRTESLEYAHPPSEA